MKVIKLILVAGARPNFMKIAPLMRALGKQRKIQPILVHTGQHYDSTMSDTFFRQLGIPKPNINLEVGSASHAAQTARIMERFEEVCHKESPNAVLVVGDVNSTAACVLTAAKMKITTIHYEAGLRSFDREMPEEINRVVTDAICDFFFTTSEDADRNLLREGKDPEQIFMCGNLMIDSLVMNLDTITSTSPEIRLIDGEIINPIQEFGVGNYGVITLHRPANVDEKATLKPIMDVLKSSSRQVPLIFPVHPRTLKKIESSGLAPGLQKEDKFLLSEPLGYIEFMALLKNAGFLITDSGGIQEETTWLNIPCLTLRKNTERPITTSIGSNKLIGPEEIETEIEKILMGKGKSGDIPPLWDGKAAKRIVEKLEKIIN